MALLRAAVKIDTFAYLPVQDFGNAFSTFVAQNYGAGNQERIRKGTRVAFAMSIGFSVMISVLVCLFVSGPLMKIFVSGKRGGCDRAGGEVSPDRRCVLSWYWLSVSAVWLLPGDQASGDVGCADGDLAGAPCSAGLCSFCCDW